MEEASFDHIADEYDKTFTFSNIGKLQRKRVWHWLDQSGLKSAPVSVLELNCGTGEDARLFAERGHSVLATDWSKAMLAVTDKKAREAGRSDRVKTALLDFNALENFESTDKYDFIFSNFGGLNCVDEEGLSRVGEFASKHLKEGGKFIAVVMPQYCRMEIFYFFFKLRWRWMFRRATRKGVHVNVGGEKVSTWFYSPRRFMKCMKPNFIKEKQRPVAYMLPPSYLDPYFSERLATLGLLNSLEGIYGRLGFLSGLSDHYIIVMKKR